MNAGVNIPKQSSGTQVQEFPQGVQVGMGLLGVNCVLFKNDWDGAKLFPKVVAAAQFLPEADSTLYFKTFLPMNTALWGHFALSEESEMVCYCYFNLQYLGC